MMPTLPGGLGAKSAVLIVEDDELTAELERRSLARAGFATCIATRVAQAQQLLSEQVFSAIVLDYHLPDSEPWAIVDRARAMTPRVPVVLVTAAGSEHVAAEALHRGVGDYVRKSVHLPQQLGDTVSRVVNLAQAEERLRRSGALFQLIADHADDMIMTLDAAGSLRYVSAACRHLLGFEMTDLAGRPIADLLHPDDDLTPLLGGSPVALPAALRREIFRLRHRDGHYVWVESNLQRVHDPQSGALLEVVGVTRDISSRMIAQQKTEAALREKTVLLDEVHQRVQDNLQIIVSLLMLQREHSGHAEVRTALAGSEARVRSMALIHQFLHERKNFARLDLVDYLQQLGQLIDGMHCGSQRGIGLRVSGPAVPLWLAFEQAVPCGLLVNELLGNAYRHAFPAGRSGGIRIEVFAGDDGDVQLAVCDDGIGLPQGFGLHRPASLGLQLATTLVERLGGRWRVDGSRVGARFEVSFPLREAAARAIV